MKVNKQLVLLLNLAFALIAYNSFAGTITMPQYNPGGIVTADNQNQRFNLLTNEINGGLTGANADVDGGWRFIEVLGALPAAGNAGRIVSLTADNTFQLDTGTVWKVTGVLSNDQIWTGFNTFTGNSTFAGTTIVDLGSVTTADTNGGTIDNTIIGATTAVKGTFSSLHLEEIAAPSTASSEGAIYTKDTNGQPELFYREESSGDEVQITDTGFVLARSVQIFTGSGTFTAPSGKTKVYLTLLGGGGGGGGGTTNGGGGGAGGYYLFNIPFTVTPGNDYTVTIGAGGTSGSGPGGNGGTGGTTSFDSLSVLGGDGGLGDSPGTGGVSLDFNASGSTGGTQRLQSGNGDDGGSPNGGGGGGTAFGDGADGTSTDGDSASTNSGGGGGGGGSGAGKNGGVGGSGICIVIY